MLLYWPVKDGIQAHLLTPLRVGGRVVVVSRVFSAHPVHRGEWVAYQLQLHQQGDAVDTGMVRIHSGTGFGEVLAVAGDTVTFSGGKFSVNGNWRPSLAKRF